MIISLSKSAKHRLSVCQRIMQKPQELPHFWSVIKSGFKPPSNCWLLNNQHGLTYAQEGT